jgi:hypothetical protein
MPTTGNRRIGVSQQYSQTRLSHQVTFELQIQPPALGEIQSGHGWNSTDAD